METYEQMLEEAYSKIKSIPIEGERFKIPEIEVTQEGKNTIIMNFSNICSYLNRNEEHLEKYLQKELATPSKKIGNRLILQRKLLIKDINEKIKSYIEKFVICKECKKPDTKLERKDSFYFIHCLACGAKHSIPKI
ncbi:MAG: translation initiation factor IF-2 subunit beta [Candidatus Pacearchaeota archaeon]